MTRLVDKFNTPWTELPVLALDVETTGLDPVDGGVCQIGLARFEAGKCVGTMSSIIDPACEIPESATQVHGITDEMVRGAPLLSDWFQVPDVQRFVSDCQPLAHNASFDRAWMPPGVFDPYWPWFDMLVVSRATMQDGRGRHKLESICKKLKIELKAHDAESDARACGEAFFKVTPMAAVRRKIVTLGQMLCWMQHEAAEDWYRFHDWLSRQPPKEQP